MGEGVKGGRYRGRGRGRGLYNTGPPSRTPPGGQELLEEAVFGAWRRMLRPPHGYVW